MAEFFQSATSYPYIYILIFAIIGLVVALIWLLLFRKRIFAFLKKVLKKGRFVGIKFRKENSVEFGVGSNSPKSIALKQIDMEDSKIEDISGSVKMDDIKMKKSSIGSIRSE